MVCDTLGDVCLSEASRFPFRGVHEVEDIEVEVDVMVCAVVNVVFSKTSSLLVLLDDAVEDEVASKEGFGVVEAVGIEGATLSGVVVDVN